MIQNFNFFPAQMAEVMCEFKACRVTPIVFWDNSHFRSEGKKEALHSS